jgi:hypothetical protein
VGTEISHAIQQWKNVVKIIQTYDKMMPNFKTYYYEDIAEKPKETFEDIFDFLGVDTTDVEVLVQGKMSGKKA